MKKIIILIIFLLFLTNTSKISVAALSSLNLWGTTIFPILFPTMIITDLLLSLNLLKPLSNTLGKIYAKIFKTSKYGVYVFLLSFISATPTNAKNLISLKQEGFIKENDLTKILCTCLFFNPFLVINFCGKKILIIVWLSNIIASIITRNYLVSNDDIDKNKKINFNLSSSINNNIDIILNILGTITVFSCLSAIIPGSNIYLKTFITGILEFTNGLNLLKLYNFNNMIKEIFALIFLIFGSFSIIFQIKGILKDSLINIPYFTINRIIALIIGLLICFIT